MTRNRHFLLQLNSMKKRVVYVFFIFSLALNVLLIGYVLYSQRPLSEKEIKDKFDCNRVTLEIRSTDIFCNNPDAYRRAVE
jgi:hypothetical protein